MYSIHGWVEVRRGLLNANDEEEWQGVLRLDPLIDVYDAVSERLFGLSKTYVSGALAKDRGVPSDASQEVRLALAGTEDLVESGELAGHTHASWLEMESAALDERVLAESDWRVVLRFVSELARDHRLGADRVRVVVWCHQW